MNYTYICVLLKSYKTMSLRIDEVLEQKKVSVAELARMTGVERSTMYTTIKRGNPTFETLEKIAQALEVPITDLFEPPATVPAGANVVCPNCGAALEVQIKAGAK